MQSSPSAPRNPGCAGTELVGVAASAVIFAGGTKGKRRIPAQPGVDPPAPVERGLGGEASDIEIHAEEIVRMKQSMIDILARHSGQLVDKIGSDTDRDRWLTTEKAWTTGWSTR